MRMLLKEVPRDTGLFSSKNLEHAQYALGGLGNCQVKALRDWARSMSFLEVFSATESALSSLARLVCQFDPCLEEDGTWWVIHARLASNPDDIWFYSYYARDVPPGRFAKTDLRSRLQAYRGDSDSYIAKKCLFPLMHTMSATRLGADLGLLRVLDGQCLERVEPEMDRLPASVVAFMIVDWMSRHGRQTVGIDEIAEADGPARYLGMPRALLDAYLDLIQDRYAKAVLWVSRTSGLNSVAREARLKPYAVLRAYYLEHLEGLSPTKALNLGIEQEATGGNRDVC